MQIKVYGPGCERHHRLLKNVRIAIAELNIDAEVIEINKIEQIAEAGFSNMPGLTIDDEPVIVGQVLSIDELKIIIWRYRRLAG